MDITQIIMLILAKLARAYRENLACRHPYLPLFAANSDVPSDNWVDPVMKLKMHRVILQTAETVVFPVPAQVSIASTLPELLLYLLNYVNPSLLWSELPKISLVVYSPTGYVTGIRIHGQNGLNREYNVSLKDADYNVQMDTKGTAGWCANVEDWARALFQVSLQPQPMARPVVLTVAMYILEAARDEWAMRVLYAWPRSNLSQEQKNTLTRAAWLLGKTYSQLFAVVPYNPRPGFKPIINIGKAGDLVNLMEVLGILASLPSSGTTSCGLIITVENLGMLEPLDGSDTLSYIEHELIKRHTDEGKSLSQAQLRFGMLAIHIHHRNAFHAINIVADHLNLGAASLREVQEIRKHLVLLSAAMKRERGPYNMKPTEADIFSALVKLTERADSLLVAWTAIANYWSGMPLYTPEYLDSLVVADLNLEDLNILKRLSSQIEKAVSLRDMTEIIRFNLNIIVTFLRTARLDNIVAIVTNIDAHINVYIVMLQTAMPEYDRIANLPQLQQQPGSGPGTPGAKK